VSELNLILLGPPGAGKGTQAQRLIEDFRLPYVATGEMLRAAVREETDLGKEAKKYMNNGDLVPDEVIIGVAVERLQQDDCKDGFILDGFPRTLVQAEELEKVLTDHPLDLVLDIEVPTETILDRIAGRRVCANCGATYHVNNRPEVNWTCDVCGGEVVQRDDDTEEAVAKRLEVYAHQTVPIIDFYRNLGKLVVVDGVGNGDEVQERLVKEIDGRFDPGRR
jgi:adenylate kinase